MVKFLRKQLPEGAIVDREVIAHEVPPNVYHSARATFHSPSDSTSRKGIKNETIRACPSWRNEGSRYDCVLVETNANALGFLGLHVARVQLFFSFEYAGETFECALVHWFEKVANEPDELTGMWVVKKEFLDDDPDFPHLSVIHVDSILRAAHLMPCFGNQAPAFDHNHRATLDTFDTFFVNKYIDIHAYEIAS